MRIIAGEYRSRKLWTPEGLSTRPMPDRIRESIFGMLGLRVQNAAVVDLFAGSGSMAFEALSRGASSAILVERDRLAAGAIERNIETLKCQDRARLILGDALGMAVVARCPRPTDLIFLDPPYPLITEAIGWQRVRQQCAELVGLLADDGFLILRTPHPFLVSPEASAGAAHESASGSEAPARRIDTPRFARKRKYQRERTRWEEMPDAPSTGRMRRGSARPPQGPSSAPSAGRPPRDEPLDEPIDEGELVGGLLAAEAALGDESGAGEADDGVRVAFTAGPGAAQASAAASAPPPVPGDLSIPGAIGPESHAYGSCAVHWYQRSRAT